MPNCNFSQTRYTKTVFSRLHYPSPRPLPPSPVSGWHPPPFLHLQECRHCRPHCPEGHVRWQRGPSQPRAQLHAPLVCTHVPLPAQCTAISAQCTSQQCTMYKSAMHSVQVSNAQCTSQQCTMHKSAMHIVQVSNAQCTTLSNAQCTLVSIIIIIYEA